MIREVPAGFVTFGLSGRTDRTMRHVNEHAAMSHVAQAIFGQVRGFYGTRFRRAWVGRDLLAGLVLASLLIPQ